MQEGGLRDDGAGSDRYSLGRVSAGQALIFPPVFLPPYRSGTRAALSFHASGLRTLASQA